MKFVTAFIFVGVLLLNSSLAQNPVLFGTTTTGNGGIFRYDSKDNVIKNVYRFKNAGKFGGAKMIRADNGLIYGVAGGGPFGYGIIYSLDPISAKYKIEKSFREVDGAEPISLVQGKDGKLYGTTDRGNGQSYPEGVLFSFDPASSAFDVLLYFSEVTAFLTGELTAASDGLLYGIASDFTGDYVYSFDPATRVFVRETYLPESFGHLHIGAMIEANETLYGVKELGGAHDGGVLFSYSLKTKNAQKLIDFNPETGINPHASLILGSDGKLYSTTSNIYRLKGVAATIYCFDPKSNSMNVIHKFESNIVGNRFGDLAEGSDGKLYGMCPKIDPGNGSDQPGSIFYSIDKSGDNYRVLRNFDHGENYFLAGNIIVLDDKLYGSAVAENTIPYPYIFSYKTSQDLFQKVVSTNLDKGLAPAGSLLHASDGRLYGVANEGGGFGLGGIFSFNPGTGLYNMLMPFNKERGYMPQNDIVQAEDGRLYGVTFSGGAKDHGVIFSYDPQKMRYVIEKSFNDNYIPLTGFTRGNDGTLYSSILKHVTIDGVPETQYQLFSFNPKTKKYKELNVLCCGGVSFTQSSDGKLYAPFPTGIYAYEPATNTLEQVYSANLSSPYYSTYNKLLEAADHKLYAIGSYGGTAGTGMLYSFDPSDRSYTAIHEFDEESGIYPRGNLQYASDGKFYGTTSEGGLHNLGALFSYDPATLSFEVLRHFDQYSGGNAGPGELVELNTANPPIISITDQKKFEGETAELTVSLNRISMEPVILNFRTLPGTANDGGKNPDFTSTSGQVTIPPGEISTTISVSLLEDNLIENRETFTVVLQKANEALFELGDSIGVINIKNGSAPIIPPGGEIITLTPKPVASAEREATDKLVIRATPNPSSDFFRLHIEGNKTDRVSVTVTNLSGQIMDKFDGALKNSQLVFGQNYQSGSYFVRIVNGRKGRVIKLVKTSK